jgi:hypothetical protein
MTMIHVGEIVYLASNFAMVSLGSNVFSLVLRSECPYLAIHVVSSLRETFVLGIYSRRPKWVHALTERKKTLVSTIYL